MIILVYFSFTTLSTVGLGDLYPANDTERIYQSIVLFLGVVSFTFIMNNFLIILQKTSQIKASFEEGAKLSKFIGLLKKYNGN